MTLESGIDLLPGPGRLMTAEEFYRLPEGPPWSQLIEGELHMSPSPNFFHQEILSNIQDSMRPYVKKHRLGKVVRSPSDVELNSLNVYQPDLYFISRARLALIDKHGLKGAPDLVVEAISSSTGRLDRGPKKSNYAQAGVREFWVVMPKTQEIEIWLLQVSVTDPAQRLGIGDTLKTELLPGWEMPVADVFEE